MDTWRITTLGQLESLLTSDTAATAVPEEGMRQRLRLRCTAVQSWIELWREGRGRPVTRSVLEQAGAVSAVFLDRTASLAERLDGDGEALVRELRAGALPHFHKSKADALAQWLADEGYTDDRPRLTADDRRRLTLQRAAPVTEAAADDLNRLVDWLESAAGREG